MAQNSTEIERLLDLYSNAALIAMMSGRKTKKKPTRKPEMIAELASAIRDSASTQVAFNSLSAPAQVMLRLLREQGGAGTIGALKVAASAVGIANFDAHFDELLRKVVVLYASPGQARHELWEAKSPGYGSWQKTLEWKIEGVEGALALADDSVQLPAPARALEAYQEEPYAIEESRPATLLHVVWSVVRWATEREITLTKTSGTIRKADLKALDNQLKEQADMKGFALALALEVGLLRRQREQILAHADAPAFFARPPREQVEKLFDAWVDLSNWSEFFRIAEIECESQTVPRPSTYHWGTDQSDVPTTEALPAARAYVVSVLKRAGSQNLGGWQSLASLRDLVKNENSEFLIPISKQRGRSSYLHGGREVYQGFWPADAGRWSSSFERQVDWNKVEGRFLRQMLCEPLNWLGIVAIARDAANEVVAFRLSPLGAHLLGLSDALPEEADAEVEKPLIIQPNFEIMAYTEAAHLPVLYQLERFANRERAERVAHYKLDRESVYRGLQDGLSAREMREFLEQHSRSGLPQNIAYSLDDWQSLWERVTVRASTSVIEADSEAELDAFLATLPADGATKLAPCWALIEARYGEVARNALASRGARGFDYNIETEQAFTTSENLEISVPLANLDLWLRAKLAQFADEAPATKGKARYQITRASVERAAQIGVNAEAILGFLREIGTPPIPANVSLTVRGWGGAVKPVALGAMQVLVAAPETIAQMASIEEVRALLWLGGDGIALIQTADVPKLKAQLKGRGIAFDGKAEAHLKAPPSLEAGATPRRLKPAGRGVEIGVKRVVKRVIVPAHPDESEVDLQIGLTESEIEDLLETAMLKSRCVVIEYQSKVRLALRKINPLQLVEDGGHNYIGAWDHWRKGDRLFRLDRITRIALLDERFDPDRFG